MMGYLRDYLYTGGMPEVVQAYVNKLPEYKLKEIKSKIYNGNRLDITKFMDNANAIRQCLSIYDSLKIFHAKPNNKFRLSTINKNARYTNYENAINNIILSNIVYKVDNVKRLSTPLYVVDEPSNCKIYFNDCGILTYALDMDMEHINSKENKYANQRGSLVETFVLSEIKWHIVDSSLHYFSFRENELSKTNASKSNKTYEVDFLLEDNRGYIVPIEVKYGKMFNTLSLDRVMTSNNVSQGIIFSSNNINFNKDNKIINLPLY